MDSLILEMLLDDDAARPWTVGEIASEIGNPIHADDGVGRLARAGLVHRLKGFVWASRAAIAAHALHQ